MITLSEKAKQKFISQLQKRGKGIGVKIGVKPTGCSGLSYILEYVDNPCETDTKITLDNLTIYIDPKHLVYLTGIEIDYVKQDINEGFEFVNPNERGKCGCGQSFTV